MDVKEQKEQNMQDEISIIDLLAILLRYKWIVIVITLLSIIISILFYKYKNKAIDKSNLDLVNNREYTMDILVKSSSKNFNDSSKIGNFALYLFSSNIENFVLSFENVESRDEFKNFLVNNISCKYNDKNSVFSISLVHSNEDEAYFILQTLFNYLSNTLNDFDYENCVQLINFTSEKVERDSFEKVERDSLVLKYTIFIIFIGFVFSIILVYTINGFNNLKNNKEVMNKLFPKKK